MVSLTEGGGSSWLKGAELLDVVSPPPGDTSSFAGFGRRDFLSQG